MLKNKLLTSFLIVLAIVIWIAFILDAHSTIKEAQIKDYSTRFQSVASDFDKNINKTLTFVYGLRGFVLSQIDSGLTQDEFKLFAEESQSTSSYVKNFSIAPDNIQSFVHPLEGNEVTLGHDLNNDTRENVRNDVREAMESDTYFISGPYELRQGGVGMILRNPIYNEGSYWGLVNVVVNLDNVFAVTNFESVEEITFNIEDETGSFFSNGPSKGTYFKYSIDFESESWTIFGYYSEALNTHYKREFIQLTLLSLLVLIITIYFIFKLNSKNFILSKRIANMIFIDTLTSLSNRRSLEANLNNLIQHKKEFALAFLDLDNFKDINDSLGHSTGDEILKIISKRIDMNESIKPYRWGGDEFVLIKERTSLKKFKNDIAQIQQSIKEKIIVNGEEFFVTASIGLIKYPDHDDTVGGLIKLADATMYHAKSMGKNKIQLYERFIGHKIKEEFYIEKALDKALDNHTLELYYQPRYNFATNKIDSVEGLLRWSNGGVDVSPGHFIPIAEKSNLISKIDAYVIEKAIIQLKKWQEKDFYMNMAINISASSVSLDILPFIEKLIVDHGINSEYLEFEITETATIEDIETARNFILGLKKLGIQISLDDFGTGHSSLSYLKVLKLDILKIDKAFIDALPDDPVEVGIIEAILKLSKSLGLMTVAEGVEHQGQFDKLRELGCDFFQGYLLSRAIKCQEVEEFIQDFNHGDGNFQ